MQRRLIHPDGYHYDCHSCSKCCHTEWNVFIDPPAYDKMLGSPLFQRLQDQHGTAPMFVEETDSGPACKALVNENGCVFLDSDNLCMIHREMGLASKPLGCREFPFLPIPTPDGVVVGLSFYCTSVQDDQGRPTTDHEDKIIGLLREYRYNSVGFKPIPLTDRVAVSWESYKLVEEMAREDLASFPDTRSAAWHTLKKIILVSLLAERAVLPAGEDEAPSQGEPVVLEHDHFADMLEMAAVDHIAMDECFRAVENMFLLGVMGVLEAGNDRSLRRGLTDTIAARETFHSAIFRRDVDLRGFDDFRDGVVAGDLETQSRRYLDMLVFRKFLAQKRNILANASLYFLTLSLLEWYRDLSAFVNGRFAPEMEDVRLAFDVMERDLNAHTRGLDAFFYEMGRTYARQLELVPGVFTGAPGPPRPLGLFAD